MRERNGGGGFRPHGGGGFTAPVKVGDEIDVKIEAVGEKGDGIAKEKGFVLFVPNTKEGDEVRIRVTKVLRKVGFAEVIGESTGAGKKEQAPAEEEAPSQEAPEESSPESSEEDSEDSQDSDNFGEEEYKEE
jgi:predicted RNA-binding protein with TRAM domain